MSSEKVEFRVKEVRVQNAITPQTSPIATKHSLKDKNAPPIINIIEGTFSKEFYYTTSDLMKTILLNQEINRYRSNDEFPFKSISKMVRHTIRRIEASCQN
ncbi:unnamed protein product [Thelazia callipaeda]|uniref:Uncharacterized protein n=1 Tax=Thelazia callipaeda TaxID=103827 RepID=A0A0N5CZI3_THECL|nr:unnamed protein product [Thelazia callipaeda]